MPINIQRLREQRDQRRIHPRDIFAALPDKPYTRLRLEQGEVLNKWFDRRNERDLVIKQNTGGGKTAIGLLIAQSSINEGEFPVAYLVPDNYLVDQVIDEAEALGIAATRDPRSLAFHAGQVVLVATLDRVINGRSVFGLLGSPNPVILGTVIIDDAHSAIARTQDKFRIHLPAKSSDPDGTPIQTPEYLTVLRLFAEGLRAQNQKNYLALIAGDRCGPMRVPFWAWAANQDAVIAILSELARNNAYGVDWAWPLVSDHLLTSTAVFSGDELEIRPFCPPISKIPAIHQAKRRVYLTATLADDGVLVTELDADPESVRRPITPERAADLGDRLILAPLALNPSMSEEKVRAIVRSFADGDWDGDGAPDHQPVNVVVLVPSDRKADAWSPWADETLHVRDMKPVVDDMQTSHRGVVVLVNKYDGVDLLGEACRILVLDGIPTPLSPSEQRESAALSGSATFRGTKVQRIEQGMGRGIRDADDYCAVILLGSDLALSQVDPGALEVFSPATRAQIEVSQGVSGQIVDEGEDSIRQALEMFLSRERDWLELSRGATSSVQYAQVGHVSDLAVARRQAFDAAEAGEFDRAAATLNAVADRLDDPREKGWVLEEAASYRHRTDAADAQRLQLTAKRLNTQLLLPTAPGLYRRPSARNAQADEASQYLDTLYSNGTQLVLEMDQIIAAITWDPALVSPGEEALRKLGLHLGFQASRPDNERNEGPDVLWIMSANRHAIIEAKTGVVRANPKIVKSEANQLSGSFNWHEKVYPEAINRVPVFVHPSRELASDAVPPKGTRVVTPVELQSLGEAVKLFARAIATREGWKTPSVVREALTMHDLTADRIFDKYSTAALVTTS